MYLMLKDTKVLYFDFEDFVVEVINDDLLPFCLRSDIRASNAMKDILHNVQAVKSYLSSRILSLSRDNAKQIYAAFQIPQIDSIDNRVNICTKCKGVSIQDSYWVREDSEETCWNHVNIRQNKLYDIVNISLSGFNPTITTSRICPELTTKGLFRKGWIHLGNELYMLKSDRTNNYVNTKMEILASDMLTCFENRIDCVAYVGDIKETTEGTEFVSICKNFVDEEYSFVEAWEVMEYLKRCGMDFRTCCLRQWGNQFACIPVLDYIIINTDRHTQNYGFFMNNDTGKIEKMAPLFDYNCALVADYFQRDANDTLSQMFNTSETLRDLAHKFLPDTSIRFNEQKFLRLLEKNREYENIFERVYQRIQEMQLV
ncbi:MAG: hypothetical protein NC121_10525 [Blautia sp.]|nr:hypothetical protein [Blautia sp.]